MTRLPGFLNCSRSPVSMPWYCTISTRSSPRSEAADCRDHEVAVGARHQCLGRDGQLGEQAAEVRLGGIRCLGGGHDRFEFQEVSELVDPVEMDLHALPAPDLATLDHPGADAQRLGEDAADRGAVLDRRDL